MDKFRAYTICLHGKIAELEFHGNPNLEEWDKALIDLVNLREFTTGLALMLVFKVTDFNATKESLIQLASMLSRRRIHFSPRIAFLVEHELQYGLGRILSVFCESVEVSLTPFRDRKAAEQWLTEDSALT